MISPTRRSPRAADLRVVRHQRLGHDVAHGHPGVFKRGERSWNTNLHVLAVAPALRLAHGADVLAVEDDTPARMGHGADDGAGDGGFGPTRSPLTRPRARRARSRTTARQRPAVSAAGSRGQAPEGRTSKVNGEVSDRQDRGHQAATSRTGAWQARQRWGSASVRPGLIWLHGSRTKSQRGLNGQPGGQARHSQGALRRWCAGRRRHVSRPARPPRGPWYRGALAAEERLGRGLLHDLPPYMTSVRSQASATMPRSWGDQDDRGTEFAPDLRQKRHDLRLHRDVERRWWVRPRSRGAGRHSSAMAIMMRWRMPPENSCGYMEMRALASGMRTASSIRTASATAAPGTCRGAAPAPPPSAR